MSFESDRYSQRIPGQRHIRATRVPKVSIPYNEIEALVHCPRCLKLVTGVFQTYAAANFEVGYYMIRYCVG